MNHVETFKMIMDSQRIIVERSPSSQTTTSHEPSGESFDALIQQLKMKIVDVNLLHTIEDNPTSIYEIKAFLKQLNNPDTPDSIMGFLLEFEPFLKKTSQNVKLKKESADILE